MHARVPFATVAGILACAIVAGATVASRDGSTSSPTPTTLDAVMPAPRVVVVSHGTAPNDRRPFVPDAHAGLAPSASASIRSVALGAPIRAGVAVLDVDHVAVVTTDARLVVLGADGRRVATHALDAGSVVAPIATDDGALVIGTDAGTVLRIGRDGVVRARARLGAPVDGLARTPTGFVAVAGETVTFLGDGLDTRAHHPLAARSTTTPAVARDGTVFVGTQDERLVAVGPDGARTFEVRLRADVHASPVLGPDGTVYAAADDGTVIAIDARDRLRFAVRVPAPIRAGLGLAASALLVVSTLGPRPRVVGIDARDGRLRWVFSGRFTDGPEDGFHGATTIAREGSVLVGGDDDALHVIDARGIERARFLTTGDVLGRPSFLADGTMVFGAMDGVVRFVAPRTSDTP